MLPAPYIPINDIERRMEMEIETSGLWAEGQEGIFDIEAFLTSHLKADLDQDAILESQILGEVTFKSGHVPRVAINADLTVQAEHHEATWERGRWRMTLAHECAHIILHGPLFISTDQATLWEDNSSYTHRCYKTDVIGLEISSLSSTASSILSWDSKQLLNESAQTKRMEFQANMAAAALLMPRQNFIAYVQTLFENFQSTHPASSPEACLKLAVAKSAHHFCVSQQATRIRFKTLGLSQTFFGNRLIE